MERDQNGARECQIRSDKDYGFCHATTLMTASASAQTPIHSASTAIVPKATRPMPVIASLIGVFPRSALSFHIPPRGLRFDSFALAFCI
jgi:hypothetical protein